MTRIVAFAALFCSAISATPVAPAGDVRRFQIESKVYGHPRKLWVYTPPGYRPKRSSPYRLVVAFDGADYIDTIPLPKFLDSLAAAHRIPPMVAVLIENGSGAARLADLANQPAFASFLADEVVPWVRQRYNVTRDPHHTIVTGSSAGGLAAAYVALLHPDIFGSVLAQSPALWRGYAASNSAPYEWLTEQYAARPRRDVRFFLDVGSRETIHAVGVGPVFIEAVRRFRDVLRKKGYSVIYTEVPGGVHAPETWTKRLPIGLESLAGS